MKLSAAVDVQKTGFFYSIRGWGARASSWQIESGELAGFTNEPEVWNDLANVLLPTLWRLARCAGADRFRLPAEQAGRRADQCRL